MHTGAHMECCLGRLSPSPKQGRIFSIFFVFFVVFFWGGGGDGDGVGGGSDELGGQAGGGGEGVWSGCAQLGGGYFLKSTGDMVINKRQRHASWAFDTGILDPPPAPI